MVLAVTTTGRPLGGPGPATSARCRSSFVLIVGFLVVQVARRPRHRLAGPAVRRRPHGHRRPRAGHGPGRDPRRLERRAPTRSARSGCTASRSWPRWPTPCCCSGSPPTCSYEAVIRLGEDREIASVPVLVVGLLGLAVNVVAFLLLRAGAEGEPERRGRLPGGAVRRRSARSASSSAAIVWGATGWTWVDPVIGAAIGVFILPRAFRLGREAVRILVQAAPARIDVPALRADLAGIPGVVDVHDLHVWTLTSDMEVASAHLMVRIGTDSHGVLDQARASSSSATASATPPSRSSPTTTGAATRSPGDRGPIRQRERWRSRRVSRRRRSSRGSRVVGARHRADRGGAQPLRLLRAVRRGRRVRGRPRGLGGALGRPAPDPRGGGRLRPRDLAGAPARQHRLPPAARRPRRAPACTAASSDRRSSPSTPSAARAAPATSGWPASAGWRSAAATTRIPAGPRSS